LGVTRPRRAWADWVGVQLWLLERRANWERGNTNHDDELESTLPIHPGFIR
jgi:hypothetical protein